MRNCANCGDPVVVRHDREGLIHKGPKVDWGDKDGNKIEFVGWYVCRGTRDMVAE